MYSKTCLIVISLFWRIWVFLIVSLYIIVFDLVIVGDVEPGVVGDDVVMDRQYRLCVRLYPSNLQKNFYNMKKKTQNIQF